MHKVLNSMFPHEKFENLKKLDGILGVLFYAYFIFTTCLLLLLVKNEYIKIPFDNGMKKIVQGVLLTFPVFLGIFILLRVRKQNWSSIGLSSKGLSSSVIIGILLTALLVILYTSKNGYTESLVCNITFYLFFVGFFEELTFRGFLWPRFVILFGRSIGTLTTGALFGIAHAPIAVIIYNSDVIGSIINNIGGGIVYTLLMVFIYTRNKNILLPAFIHGFFDALSLV